MIADVPVFDIVLALSIVAAAWQLLSTLDLFKSVVIFIAFGLLMSLCWVRLDAVDLALVEAGIGAGLTGALFLDTIGRMEARARQRRDAASSDDEVRS